MKQSLQLKLSQQLSLTPQLQQSIRLLQLSTHELNQEIERIAQENPMLEFVDSNIEWDAPNGNQVELVSKDLSSAEEEAALEVSSTENQEIVEIEHNREPDDFQAYDYYPVGRENNNEDNDGYPLAASPLTLREHLHSQVSLSQIAERTID